MPGKGAKNEESNAEWKFEWSNSMGGSLLIDLCKREQDGRLVRTRNAFKRCSLRSVSLRELIAYDERLFRCILLGFSSCGQFLVSYSMHDTSYRIQYWRLDESRRNDPRAVQIFDVPLFSHHTRIHSGARVWFYELLYPLNECCLVILHHGPTEDDSLCSTVLIPSPRLVQNLKPTENFDQHAFPTCHQRCYNAIHHSQPVCRFAIALGDKQSPECFYLFLNLGATILALQFSTKDLLNPFDFDVGVGLESNCWRDEELACGENSNTTASNCGWNWTLRSGRVFEAELYLGTRFFRRNHRTLVDYDIEFVDVNSVWKLSGGVSGTFAICIVLLRAELCEENDLMVRILGEFVLLDVNRKRFETAENESVLMIVHKIDFDRDSRGILEHAGIVFKQKNEPVFTCMKSVAHSGEYIVPTWILNDSAVHAGQSLTVLHHPSSRLVIHL